MNERRMVTLTSFEDSDQALFYQERLENAGIEATITDDRQTEVPYGSDWPQDVREQPVMPGGEGSVHLLVAEEDSVKAAEIIEEDIDEQMGEGAGPYRPG